jgi:hypothetical protein
VADTKGLAAQLQLDDPQSPGNALGTLASKWLDWRLRQVQAVDPQDPNTFPLAPGGLGGVVRGTTPAAEELMNFVRRTWPSFGKAVDRLPDINLSYSRLTPPWTTGSGAEYMHPNRFTAPGGDIRVNTIQHGFLDAPKSAQQATEGLLHELLHALYYHRNVGMSGVDRAVPKHGETIFQRHKGELSPWRGKTFESSPAHGALDAMAKKIYRQKMPNETGRWERAFR